MTVSRYIVEYVHGKRWIKARPKINVGAHLCFNSNCCNPAHVKRKTQKANIRDNVKNGRHVSGFVARRQLVLVAGESLVA